MKQSVIGWRGRLGALVFSLVTLLFASGCTTFNHDWEKAAKLPANPGDMLGRWTGTWQSEADGHHDELRCVVTQKPNGTYRARFHAKYMKVLTFGYTVKLEATPATTGVKFSGDANLGWYAGGWYHYEGHADGTNFFATYSCKYDHGTFQMKRPPAAFDWPQWKQ